MSSDVGSQFFSDCSLLDGLNETWINLTTTDCSYNDGLYRGSNSVTYNPLAYALLQLFYVVIFITGISGNGLVIHVINATKMHAVTNLYILNLAIADILYLMGLPFLLVTYRVGNWVFGILICKLYMIITSLNQFTSSFFLSIMSVDRYIAVCHPISSQKYRTAFAARVLSLTAWASATLMVFPVFMYSRTLSVENQVKCNIFWSNVSPIHGEKLFTLYSLLLSFILPFAVIFIFYGLVIHKLRKTKSNSGSFKRRKPQRKVTRLVLALISVYTLCYFPYWALQVSLFFVPPGQSHPPFLIFLFLFSSCLSYSNSAANPILYVFLSDNFKKGFRRAFSCLNSRGGIECPSRIKKKPN